MRCERGHELPDKANFCPECGGVVATGESWAAPDPRQDASVSRAGTRVALAIGAVAFVSVLIAAIALALTSGSGDQVAERDLRVSFYSTWGQPDSGCALEPYSLEDQHLNGLRITLRNADDSVIDTGTLDPGGRSANLPERPSARCVWDVMFYDVEDSAAYTFDIQTPLDGAQSLTYSRSELEFQDWRIVLG